MNNPAHNIQNNAHDPSYQKLEDLFSQCKLGNKHAFSQIYKLTSAKLNGIAYRITGNADCANEVLQEAFIQIWQNRAEYHAHMGNIFTWLASIVRYRAYDKIRYDKRRDKDNKVIFDENEFATDEAIHNPFEQQGISQQVLDKCLTQLNPEQSESILMAYLYGYSREEISSHFSMPINTIKSWIRRGLGRLKLCLIS